MKRFILLFVLLSAVSFASFAQSSSEGKFTLSAEFGAGNLLGNSNLSPYGVSYRDAYDKAFSSNVEVFWLLDELWQVGLKYNFFTASENYEVDGVGMLAENVNLNYIAPQVGLRRMITPRLCMEYTIGAGYMHYRTEGFADDKEQPTYSTGFLGANMDLGFSYRLYKGFYMGAGASLIGGNSSSLDVDDDGVEGTVDLSKWNKIRVLRADFHLSFKAVF